MSISDIGVGWLSTLSWLAGTTTGLYLTGYLITGLAALANPGYKPSPYQGYLLVILVTIVAILINTFLAKYLPQLEGFIAIFVVLAYATVLVVLWVLGPKLTAKEVFGTFTGDAGWSTYGLNLMAVQGLVAAFFIGEMRVAAGTMTVD